MAYTDIPLPTHPGAYWYRSERTGQEVLLKIRLKDDARTRVNELSQEASNGLPVGLSTGS